MANNKTLKDGTGTNFISKTTEDGGGVNVPHVNVDNLPPGAATEATVSAINTKTPALSGGRVPVENQHSQPLTDAQLRASAVPVSGPLTDAQLRATPVPISQSSQPLPTGAATEATLAAINTKTPTLDAGDVPVILKAKLSDYWPRYSGVPSEDPVKLNIDTSGGLLTRGSVTTDEGSFGSNFSGSSLSVSIGTCSFTNGSNVVTGTGFLTASVHYGDYVKRDSDPESAWTQIDFVISDTEIRLVSGYLGTTGASASSCNVMRPITGAGGSITVSAGQCTLASGTTANALTEVEREVDYLPLVGQYGIAVSQRIINQDTYIRFYHEGNPSTPFYYAWFRLNGTVNTTVLCQTASNRDSVPSGSEIESTTVVVPNGLTTASALRYRIECLHEKVVFYINDETVAIHYRALPRPHDFLAQSVTIVNGSTPPASSTNVVIDYVRGRNFNAVTTTMPSNIEEVAVRAKVADTITASWVGAGAQTLTANIDDYSTAVIAIRGTYATFTPVFEASFDGTTWYGTTAYRADNRTSIPVAGTATGANATAIYFVQCLGFNFVRVRTTAGPATGTAIVAIGRSTFAMPSDVLAVVSGGVSISGTPAVTISAATNRVGTIGTAGIWFDDSSTALAAGATFTGTSRDLTVTATATAWANAATYGKELVVSAESEVTGTLWLEVSRDNSNWRRVKSIATAAVTGGGFYAEIVHRPSWRYARVGYTNGAGAQTRFTIGTFLKAI